MPQIKSQMKRSITNLKRNAVVSSEKSALKSAIKSVIKAVEANDIEAAKIAFNAANSKLDKAVSSGIHHKNYANRQKARLATAINKISA